MIAKHFITTTIEPIRFNETGTDILYHLDENRLSDMPVVDGTNLKGSVTESDVYTMDDPDLPRRYGSAAPAAPHARCRADTRR